MSISGNPFFDRQIENVIREFTNKMQINNKHFYVRGESINSLGIIRKPSTDTASFLVRLAYNEIKGNPETLRTLAQAIMLGDIGGESRSRAKTLVFAPNRASQISIQELPTKAEPPHFTSPKIEEVSQSPAEENADQQDFMVADYSPQTNTTSEAEVMQASVTGISETAYKEIIESTAKQITYLVNQMLATPEAVDQKSEGTKEEHLTHGFDHGARNNELPATEKKATARPQEVKSKRTEANAMNRHISENTRKEMDKDRKNMREKHKEVAKRERKIILQEILEDERQAKEIKSEDVKNN